MRQPWPPVSGGTLTVLEIRSSCNHVCMCMSVSPGCWLCLKKSQVHKGRHRMYLRPWSFPHRSWAQQLCGSLLATSHLAPAFLPSKCHQINTVAILAPCMSCHLHIHNPRSLCKAPTFLPQQPQDLTTLTPAWPPTSCPLRHPPCTPGSLGRAQA